MEWTKTLDSVLKLDFDTVIPGHGPVGTKQDLVAFRNLLEKTRNRVHEMNAANKSKEEIGNMLAERIPLDSSAPQKLTGWACCGDAIGRTRPDRSATNLWEPEIGSGI